MKALTIFAQINFIALETRIVENYITIWINTTEIILLEYLYLK